MIRTSQKCCSGVQLSRKMRSACRRCFCWLWLLLFGELSWLPATLALALCGPAPAPRHELDAHLASMSRCALTSATETLEGGEGGDGGSGRRRRVSRRSQSKSRPPLPLLTRAGWRFWARARCRQTALHGPGRRPAGNRAVERGRSVGVKLLPVGAAAAAAPAHLSSRHLPVEQTVGGLRDGLFGQAQQVHVHIAQLGLCWRGEVGRGGGGL